MLIAWESIGWTIIFALTGLGIMFLGLVGFNLLLPFKIFAEIEKGNEAVGWLVAGFLISTGIVLAESFRHNAGLLQSVLFAVIGILLNYLGYFLWEWLTPKWDLGKAMSDRSVAVGKILFGKSVAIGLIISGALTF